MICPLIAVLAAAVAGLATQECRTLASRATGLGNRRFASSKDVGRTWMSATEQVRLALCIYCSARFDRCSFDAGGGILQAVDRQVGVVRGGRVTRSSHRRSPPLTVRNANTIITIVFNSFRFLIA